IGTGTAGATESTGVGAAVTGAGPYVSVPLVCANATEESVSDEIAAHACFVLMLVPCLPSCSLREIPAFNAVDIAVLPYLPSRRVYLATQK
ncbi:hypothetical protein, partial [Halioglobus sp. HI00S01]|uniref:hypothetical protein n=1 Tax=Halioglobus sp. HI00S01 TaxID=1822214 RepID=UPI001E526016